MLFFTPKCLAFAGCLAVVAPVHTAPISVPTTPEVPAPAPIYQSVLKTYQAAPDARMAPNVVWLMQDAPIANKPGHDAMNAEMDMQMPMNDKSIAAPKNTRHDHSMEH